MLQKKKRLGKIKIKKASVGHIESSIAINKKEGLTLLAQDLLISSTFLNKKSQRHLRLQPADKHIRQRRQQNPAQYEQHEGNRTNIHIGKPMCSAHDTRQRENHKYRHPLEKRIYANIAPHKYCKNKQHHTMVAGEAAG